MKCLKTSAIGNCSTGTLTRNLNLYTRFGIDPNPNHWIKAVRTFIFQLYLPIVLKDILIFYQIESAVLELRRLKKKK